jgi:hypothetical protein
LVPALKVSQGRTTLFVCLHSQSETSTSLKPSPVQKQQQHTKAVLGKSNYMNVLWEKMQYTETTLTYLNDLALPDLEPEQLVRVGVAVKHLPETKI